LPEILIVDDNRDLLSVMVSLLELSGYGVTCAGCYEDAVALLRERRPAAIVLDYHLASQGEGLDMVKLIRSSPELTQTRVIMISGLDRKEGCIEGGADCFLQKPFELDDLLSELERLGVGTEA